MFGYGCPAHDATLVKDVLIAAPALCCSLNVAVEFAIFSACIPLASIESNVEAHAAAAADDNSIISKDDECTPFHTSTSMQPTAAAACHHQQQVMCLASKDKPVLAEQVAACITAAAVQVMLR